jgi:hypothetical protein
MDSAPGVDDGGGAAPAVLMEPRRTPVIHRLSQRWLRLFDPDWPDTPIYERG